MFNLCNMFADGPMEAAFEECQEFRRKLVDANIDFETEALPVRLLLCRRSFLTAALDIRGALECEHFASGAAMPAG